jgi:hypothetical protein
MRGGAAGKLQPDLARRHHDVASAEVHERVLELQAERRLANETVRVVQQRHRRLACMTSLRLFMSYADVRMPSTVV